MLRVSDSLSDNLELMSNDLIGLSSLIHSVAVAYGEDAEHKDTTKGLFLLADIAEDMGNHTEDFSINARDLRTRIRELEKEASESHTTK